MIYVEDQWGKKSSQRWSQGALISWFLLFLQVVQDYKKRFATHAKQKTSNMDPGSDIRCPLPNSVPITNACPCLTCDKSWKSSNSNTIRTYEFEHSSS